jgi:hypothetical protein
MTSEKSVKAETAAVANVENTVTAGLEYRRPEVHDLGKLELVQGNAVLLYRDAENTRYNMMF